MLCEVSANLGKGKGHGKSDFFPLHKEGVVSSMPTENSTHFENSGFELLSLKWETKPQET